MFVSATFANVFFFFYLLFTAISPYLIMAHIGVHHVRSAPPSLRLLGSISTHLPGVVYYTLLLGIIFWDSCAIIFIRFIVTAPAVLFLGTPGLYPPKHTQPFYFPCPISLYHLGPPAPGLVFPGLCFT
jgi:hypothetical protein